MNFIRSLLDGIVFRVAMYILRRRVVMHLGHFGGLRHFPQSGPAIIVANHESYLDSFVIAGLVWLLHGRRVWVPTKVKAFRGLLQGLLHRALGGVPIDPQHPDDAYKTVGAILNKGDVILMFPEGKRSEIREGLLPFHWGAFNLAARFDVPVIPVAVRGTRRVLPKGRRWFVEREKASVWVGPLQMSRAKPAQSKDLETRASAGVIRKSCESIIQQVVSADESRMSRQRGPEARWLSEFIDSRIEHLLEGGVEQITARQASDVIDRKSVV